MASVLVVGAGFAGATYARTLAEAGVTVQVIDRRDHVGGNAFDAVDTNGVRVHRYGPHLFHTNSAEVFAWLGRFADWVPYRHRVRAALPDGRLVPLPVNLDTINAVFGERLQDAAAAGAFLQRIAVPIAEPRNAAEYLRSRIGDVLTDLFFRRYTRKMWALDLEDMHPSVVQRVPIRFDRVDAYFPDDRFQALPRDGYAALFERILDHQAITVTLGTAYAAGMEQGHAACFNSMAIDEFFECALGPLPYRSIRFHPASLAEGDACTESVTNFTDDRPFTREVWWHCLPGHLVRETGRRTATREEPCDYRENALERYYPVRTADQRYQKLYRDYRALADGLANMQFIGRCGTYQYLDMDQVINQSLIGARRWLAERSPPTS
jgi:UDP-galactopyranose mutase